VVFLKKRTAAIFLVLLVAIAVLLFWNLELRKQVAVSNQASRSFASQFQDCSMQLNDWQLNWKTKCAGLVSASPITKTSQISMKRLYDLPGGASIAYPAHMTATNLADWTGRQFNGLSEYSVETANHEFYLRIKDLSSGKDEYYDDGFYEVENTYPGVMVNGRKWQSFEILSGESAAYTVYRFTGAKYQYDVEFDRWRRYPPDKEFLVKQVLASFNQTCKKMSREEAVGLIRKRSEIRDLPTKYPEYEFDVQGGGEDGDWTVSVLYHDEASRLYTYGLYWVDVCTGEVSVASE